MNRPYISQHSRHNWTPKQISDLDRLCIENAADKPHIELQRKDAEREARLRFPIYCVEDPTLRFRNAVDAAKHIGMAPSSIRESTRVGVSIGGYHWRDHRHEIHAPILPVRDKPVATDAGEKYPSMSAAVIALTGKPVTTREGKREMEKLRRAIASGKMLKGRKWVKVEALDERGNVIAVYKSLRIAGESLSPQKDSASITHAMRAGVKCGGFHWRKAGAA